ncbi:MAG TPA: SAM-dependent methyltransferase [Myxococcota bacterium]
MLRAPSILAVVVALAAGCATPPPPPAPSAPPTPAEIVAASDRDADDVALDAGREPAALLDFLDVRPGMVVADLGAGRGYTTELLARAVGPEGRVYAQNPKFVVEKFADAPLTARLKKPVNNNVVRVDREFDAPLPPEANGTVDVVINVLFYHDTVWLKVDRAAMNAAIFDALKPGGSYVVVDHSGRDGSGTSETQTLHRIEQSSVVAEILGAGFVLAEEAHFLRHAEDRRDWNASPGAAAERRGESDRFVLKFKKPG